jgi:hypothetical protein
MPSVHPNLRPHRTRSWMSRTINSWGALCLAAVEGREDPAVVRKLLFEAAGRKASTETGETEAIAALVKLAESVVTGGTAFQTAACRSQEGDRYRSCRPCRGTCCRFQAAGRCNATSGPIGMASRAASTRSRNDMGECLENHRGESRKRAPDCAGATDPNEENSTAAAWVEADQFSASCDGEFWSTCTCFCAACHLPTCASSCGSLLTYASSCA